MCVRSSVSCPCARAFVACRCEDEGWLHHQDVVTSSLAHALNGMHPGTSIRDERNRGQLYVVTVAFDTLWLSQLYACDRDGEGYCACGRPPRPPLTGAVLRRQPLPFLPSLCFWKLTRAVHAPSEPFIELQVKDLMLRVAVLRRSSMRRGCRQPITAQHRVAPRRRDRSSTPC